MNIDNQRDFTIDTFKGILILLVVLGHTTFPYKNYIYWFHMPAFFLISGMLFKEVNSFKQLKNYIKKRTLGSLGYYIFFLLLFSLMEPCFYTIRYDNKYIFNHLIGGRAIGGIHGVFWFITCLIITQLGFAFLNLLTKSRMIILAILIICYTLAHVEAAYLLITGKVINIPFNADVSLFAIMFFGLGYLLKDSINKILSLGKSTLIPIAFFLNLLCLIPIYLSHIGLLDYVLDMKYSLYNNFILDLLIPLLYTFAILINAKLLSKVRVFSFLGKNSLWIMYFHLPIIYILRKNNITHWLPVFILSVLCSITFIYVISTFFKYIKKSK